MAIVNGTFGNDTLIGTAGNDTIDPLDNTDFDNITATTGNDEIIFTSAANGFFDLYYWPLNAGIVLTISGQDGSVNKGANGIDTLTDVRNAILADGLFVTGTDYGDTFNVTINGGWLALQSGPGVDSYNITQSDGTIRYDFHWANQGVVIDAALSSNQVINDGWGNTENVNTTNITGGLTEIRGTDFNDTILGSDENDRFILEQGNDSLDGRDGFDTLRYDRNGVDAVTVNLQTGVATGTWDGNAFTHSIANIEEVRGSRNDGDTLTGDSNSNRFDGRGGNDTLFGGEGNDDLFGNEGNDTIYGGLGEDYIDGGEGNDFLVGDGGRNNFRGREGDDYIDASNTDLNQYGDWIKPGTGSNTIIGSLDLWNFDQRGQSLVYDDVIGSGGLNVTVGVNGSGTTISNNAGVVNDTFTYVNYLVGSEDNDTIIGGDEDRFNGYRGMAGDDSIDGRGGFDRIEYYWEARDNPTPQGVIVNFNTGVATDTFGDTDTFANIEGVEGTDLIDTFVGRNGADYIEFNGLAGNDRIAGTLTGYESARYDRDENRGGSNGIVANLSTNTIIDGFGDTDVVTNIDEVVGTRFNDAFTAGTAGVRFEGRDGNDTLFGGAGNDRLLGDDGNDFLYGGGGRNNISGGDGNDYIDTSGSDPNQFGDYIEPGFGSDTVIGSSTLWNNNEGNDISYADLDSFGGINLNVTNDGNGTVTSKTANLVNDTFSYIHYFIGSADGDTLTSTATEERWQGWQGGGGDDTINAGDGEDSLDYYNEARGHSNSSGVTVNFSTGTATDSYGDTDTFSGIEIVEGTSLADTFIGRNGADFIEFRGLEGNDRLAGTVNGYEFANYNRDESRGGNNGINANLTQNTVVDGFGDTDVVTNIDQLRATNFNDMIVGSSHHEVFEDSGGDDIVFGAAGNDTFYGGGGDDTYYGGTGNDLLITGSGGDFFNGATGRDKVFADVAGAAPGSFTINYNMISGLLANNVDASLNDTYLNVEDFELIGTIDATVSGTNGANVIQVSNGDDILFGLVGNDKLYGGGGDDQLTGGVGADILHGGTGIDEARYSDATTLLTVDLQTGVNTGIAAGDTFTSIENLFGSQQRDNLRGDTGDNKITGWNGNDFLFGRDGDDTLLGSNGSDIMWGGRGEDILNGGQGFDEVRYTDSTKGLTVDLLTANNTWIATGDTFVNVEGVFGSVHDDTLRGSNGANRLSGFFGDDTLIGRGGNDVIIGQDGNDTAWGGAGNDTFLFDDGHDADTIMDFDASGADKINLVLYSSVSSFADLTGDINSSGANVVISLDGGDQITLVNTNLGDIDASDFVF